MKKSFKETFKKIGGHRLTEYKGIEDEFLKDMIMYYSDALGNYIKQLRPTIKGWKFSIDHMTGSWEWSNRKFEDVVYATWGWEGKNEIPIETDEGDSLPKIKQKFKGTDPEDEKQLKIDAKKYIALMKKEIPKIEKKILEY